MARKQIEKKEPSILKVQSAFVMDGDIVRKGDLVEVGELDAKRLLARGKAVEATEADIKAAKGKDK